ncbi:uncharacterized protein LOC132066132 [Lycium ferocissimum]|uniref:uncharacterized protein LOC132066132 n=1 Tax=Lycium ferocissimum TaxID=112874 RepID=UPI0028157982|nr:uncharacterized protein LOC132066132 [Lycium ferocissimum]
MEPKLKEQNTGKIMKKINPAWSWVANHAFSPRGRFLIMWDSTLVDSETISMTAQLIHGVVKVISLNLVFDFTAIHWNDKIEGYWKEYTWTNGHTYSILDRGLVNAEWMLNLQYSEILIMEPGCSDHSPLCITCLDEGERKPRPFRFMNHLIGHADFLDIVKETWGVESQTCTMREIWQKLKLMKQKMKVLNSNILNSTEFRGVDAKVKHYRQQLQHLQENMTVPGQPQDVLQYERETKMELEKWMSIEESIMQQKSRIQWLKLGDANTTYFFASMRNRCAQNRITGLGDASVTLLQTRDEIEGEVMSRSN